MTDPNIAAYVAYPIDNADLGFDYIQLISRTQGLLLETGTVNAVYDPGDAFNVSRVHATHPIISAVNDTALESAELVVAFLPAGVPSIGVPIEIDRAASLGKWLIIVSDVKSYSLTKYVNNPRVAICTPDDEAIRGTVERVMEAVRAAPPVTQETLNGPEGLPTLLGPGGRLPSRTYEDDAGLDLYVVGNHSIAPGRWFDVPCKVSMELPSWVFGIITGRSSTLRTKKLLVHTGIIDPGWRGELFAGALNLSSDIVTIQDGERIAQLLILPNLTREFVPTQVDQLAEHPRGTQGFGSTGI
jgi:dUTP pyrophosphatase